MRQFVAKDVATMRFFPKLILFRCGTQQNQVDCAATGRKRKIFKPKKSNPSDRRPWRWHRRGLAAIPRGGAFSCLGKRISPLPASRVEKSLPGWKTLEQVCPHRSLTLWI